MKNTQKLNTEDLKNVTGGTVIPDPYPTLIRPTYFPPMPVVPDDDDEKDKSGGATGSW